MATQLQLRRGTTAENNAFTGAPGELTMNTDTNSIRIHDGTTVGGFDIPTAATADYVVEWQAPTDLNNYTWYRKYKSGWVEQGGPTSGTDTSITITFPVVMADANYTPVLGNRSGVYEQLRISSRSETGMVVTTTVGKGSASCFWQVSGMAA